MQHWDDDGPDPAPCGEGRFRVLLVGDDEPFLRTLDELFAGQGFPTRTAFDPRTAIARVGNGHADVVVCDLGATRLQSIATVLALRQLGDDAPPIVAVSAMPNLAQHCRALRVEHFIPQPFRFSRLRELVERAGRGRRRLTEDSGVFLREQAEQILDELPDLDALNFG
ncbi:MAG: response regulator [Polyangiales bacterium]